MPGDALNKGLWLAAVKIRDAAGLIPGLGKSEKSIGDIEPVREDFHGISSPDASHGCSRIVKRCPAYPCQP
jgi:hypothetical protein